MTNARSEAMVHAVARLSVMKFFPSDPIARAEIMSILDRLVSTKHQLDWLVDTLINRVGEWPGPKEVRGVFCTKFPPADGIEADCSLGGFSSGELEGAGATASLSWHQPKLLPSGVQPVLDDPVLVEMVEELNVALPARIRPRPSDEKYAREWCEKHGLPT